MSIWPTDCFLKSEVLITGGTSGIGAGIAEAFLSEGANVTVTGVTQRETEAAMEAMPGLRAEVLDVRDTGMVADLIGSFDRLHHLVNCAGIIRREDELQADVFADVIDVNLNGTMRLCSAARPLLAQTGGTIVNTASMLSFFGGGLVPGYSASKGGVAQLTKSLAIAYAGEDIRVNAVAPGWIKTPLTQDLQKNSERSDAILQRTALKRWGTPRDIAGSVVFLASPLAGFITGAVLVVDGGYLIT